MLTFFDKVVSNEKIMGLTDLLGTTEMGRMVRDGKLSEGGFFMCSGLEGMFKSYQESEKTNQMMIKFANNVVGEVMQSAKASMEKFEQMLQNNKVFKEKISEQFDKHLKGLNDQITNLLKDSREFNTLYQGKIDLLATKREVLVDKLSEEKITEKVYQLQNEVIDKNIKTYETAMDNQFKREVSQRETIEKITVQIKEMQQSFLNFLTQENKEFVELYSKAMDVHKAIVEKALQLVDDLRKDRAGMLKSVVEAGTRIMEKVVDKHLSTTPNTNFFQQPQQLPPNQNNSLPNVPQQGQVPNPPNTNPQFSPN